MKMVLVQCEAQTAILSFLAKKYVQVNNLYFIFYFFYLTHGGTKIKLVGNLNAPWLSNRK